MVRHILPICLLVFFVAITGCERSHPGIYTQSQVEAQVMKSLKLTEIQITTDPAGGYTGTGKTAAGESFKLKLTQDVAQKSLNWKADGDRGSIEEGSFKFE